MHATTFIALGANLGNPLEQCQKALKEIKKIPHTRFVTCSSFYKTEPLLPEGGTEPVPWYVNAVCRVESSLSSWGLLSRLRNIEEAMGRSRIRKWESRLIDLDLLSYDNEVMNATELILPHPEMHHRPFVLVPLAEIAPSWVHPVLKKPVLELIRDMKNPLRIEEISDMR